MIHNNSKFRRQIVISNNPKSTKEIILFEQAEKKIIGDRHQLFTQNKGDENLSVPEGVSSYTDIDGKRIPFVDSKQVTHDQMNPNKKLNAFWLPSLTPTAPEAPMAAPVTKTMCFEGNHAVRLKQLIKVLFTPIKGLEADPKNIRNGKYQCPICCKTLANGPKVSVLKTCGHVMCTKCIKTIQKENRCYVCNKKYKAGDQIEFQSGGTGFAGNGEKLEATKTAPVAWL